MKTKIFLIIGLLLIHICNYGKAENESNSKGSKSGTITSDGSLTVQTGPELYQLVTNWANEFGKINQGIRIRVQEVPEQGAQEIMNSSGILYFFKNESNPVLKNDEAWRMIVGRDAFVPVFNAKNPLLKEINEQGISAEDFARLFNNPENLGWGSLLENDKGVPLHYFTTNDGSVNLSIAAFVNQGPVPSIGIQVKDGAEMIASIQKDANGLGFCRLSDLLKENEKSIPENLNFLPIDKNGNGRMDYFEKIYRDQNAFMRGAWIGKYPAALCTNIYSVSPVKPANEAEIAFLTWILTDGQKYLNQNGYFDLVYSERSAKVGLLTNNQVYASTSTATHPFRIVLILVAAVFVIGFAASWIYRNRIRKMQGSTDSSSQQSSDFDEKSVIAPKGLYFDKSHTWAFMEMDGYVRIGIDDFLQHITGPVTRIKMKDPGDMIKKGEKIFSIIQNGKQLAIHSPISGTIKAQNTILFSNTGTMNSSPYSEGWVYLVEPNNWIRESQFMIMAERYTEWLRYECSRLKDFFAVSLKVNKMEYAHIVLQDGGNIKDNILVDFGPEVWEDFQTSFIDASN